MHGEEAAAAAEGSGGDNNASSGFDRLVASLRRRHQKFVDDINPFPLYRWLAALAVFVVYCWRVHVVGGFFIVSYAMGIYLLNLFIGFLTPHVDPELMSSEVLGDATEDSGALPMRADDEYRPFVRQLPELKFWLSAVRVILIALCCTFVPFLDIPVFWPILVIYFFALTFITLKNQIKHMVKYRYLPFSYGKKRYPVRRT
eukprot:TRINITY_DN5687_c0_g1_i2.p2 TRINITY_DN5687_c0_g1~~TRINITY_DN5687_c0_g1_i2.p2  ORF type:complete len:211 (-),score=62.31 TRINITY_DN5687_c0_g1_i2:155-757(-)